MNDAPRPPAPPLVLAVGELLWDLLPSGKQLGGATANFAYHARVLGADALLVSRVGADPLGAEILERVRLLGLRADGVTMDPVAPTGTVEVSLDAGGTPTFVICENVAWDFIPAAPLVLDAAARAEVVCFGSLARRAPVSNASIQAILRATRPGALRVFDINLRQHFWSPAVILESLALADVLKLNHEELPVLAGLLGLTGGEEALMREIARRFRLRAVALTKGADGSLLLVGDELVSRPAVPVVVADSVGAGDSYTAVLALGLLAGDSPVRIIERAHEVAAYVCSQPGATPPMPRPKG